MGRGLLSTFAVASISGGAGGDGKLSSCSDVAVPALLSCCPIVKFCAIYFKTHIEHLRTDHRQTGKKNFKEYAMSGCPATAQSSATPQAGGHMLRSSYARKASHIAVAISAGSPDVIKLTHRGTRQIA